MKSASARSMFFAKTVLAEVEIARGRLRRFGWLRTGLAYVLAASLVLLIQKFLPGGSVLALLVLLAIAAGTAWLAQRVLQTDVPWLMLYSSAFFFSEAAIFAFLHGWMIADGALALACVSLGAAMFARSVHWSRMRSRIGAAIAEEPEHYRRARALFGAVALLALASLLVKPLVVKALWGLLPALPQHAFVVLDSILGAAIVYAFLARFTASRFSRVAGAVAWAAASARLGPNLIHLQPTFVLPLFGMLLMARHRRGGIRLATILLPLLSAFVAPGLVPAFGLIAIAALAAGALEEAQRDDATISLVSTVLGTLLALFAPALFAAPSIIVSGAIDQRLREISADGAWPWELFYPAITGGAGNLGAAVAKSIGRPGNLLLTSFSFGEATILAAILGVLYRKHVSAVIPRFAAFLLFAGIFFALPSRLYGVPLPTFAEVLSLLAPAKYFFPAAGVAVSLASAVIMCKSVEAIQARRAAIAISIVLVALAVQTVPNPSLFVSARQLNMVPALLYAAHTGAKTQLFASRYTDDPWAVYGRYAEKSAQAPNVLETTLPPTGYKESSADTNTCLAVINYGAYQGYNAPGISTYIFEPVTFYSQTAQPPEPSLRVVGNNLEKIYGDVAVYNRCSL